jgi:hypothetical protein
MQAGKQNLVRLRRGVQSACSGMQVRTVAAQGPLVHRDAQDAGGQRLHCGAVGGPKPYQIRRAPWSGQRRDTEADREIGRGQGGTVTTAGAGGWSGR